MKKYLFFALVFLFLLLVGTAFGLREQKPTDEFPVCQSPCFWGFVHHIIRHMTPPWDEEVPTEGAKVVLWFGGAPIDTEYTDGVGEYCFSGSWLPGDYVIKVACLQKQVHRVGNENIRVDFLFRSPCRADLPVNPPVPSDPVPGDPQT